MPEVAQIQEVADESSLIAAACRRDAQAIRLIIRQHNQRLYRIARSIVRDDSEAEDVLQDSYLRAFTHLDSFRAQARLGTWLARIVMNEALGRLRRRREFPNPVAMMTSTAPMAEVIPFPGANAQLDPETTMAQREIGALLERAIDKLPDAFRTVLVARTIEGMSIEETAELLGILPETVKTRLHRARHLLKAEMAKHIGPVMVDAFPFAGRRCERLCENVLQRLGVR